MDSIELPVLSVFGAKLDENKGPVRRGVLLSTAMLAIICYTTVLNPLAATQAAPQRVEVTAKKYGFEPGEVTIKKGQPVDLALKSADVAHGLRFRELNVDLKVNKGATVDVHFTPDKVGSFVGHCSVFCGSGHGRMTLTLHVVE